MSNLTEPLAFPECIHVQHSGRDGLDGKYMRMEDASRGKPCYMKGTQKDSMYLYWFHGKWKLGCELGSHKSYAYSKEQAGEEHPCDDCHSWNVYDAKAGEYKAAPSDMQVRSVEIAPLAKKQRQIRSAGEKQPLSPEKKASTESTAKRRMRLSDDVPAQFKAGAVKEDGGASATRRKQCSDDLPAQFKSGVSGSTKEQASPSSQAVSDLNACLIPGKTLLLPPSPVAMFEEKLRALLSSLPDPEKQQMRLEKFREKLKCCKLPHGLPSELALDITDRLQLEFGTKRCSEKASAVSTPSSQESVPLPRNPQDGLPSPNMSYAGMPSPTMTSQEGMPSPKRPRILPGQPETPPEKFQELPSARRKLSGFW